MDNEFNIPNKSVELTVVSSSQYYVGDVSSVIEIKHDFRNFHEDFNEHGVDFISKNFDKYYSILNHFSDVPQEIRIESYGILLAAFNMLANDLMSLLEDDITNPCTRFRYRNLLKMSIYLLTQLADAFEGQIARALTLTAEIKKGRKKKSPVITTACEGWEEKRREFVSCIISVYNLPINKLWEPPFVDPQFIQLATRSFFYLFENPNVIHDSILTEDIIDFLGFVLKTHKVYLDYSMKMLELVQRFPLTIQHLASAVHLYVTKYEEKGLIPALFRELDCIETQETETLHSLSQFIMGITERCWEQVFASINYLLPCLEDESHIMRNCVLLVIGELATKISETENPSKEITLVLDIMIKKLFLHIHDSSSFVRCKSLQILCQLVYQNSLPTRFHQEVLETAIGRLQDKASTVRKNAVAFLKIFLLTNPFSAQIELEDLRQNYEKQKASLDELLPQLFTPRKRRLAVNFDSDDDDSFVVEADKENKEPSENVDKDNEEPQNPDDGADKEKNDEDQQQEDAKAQQEKIVAQRVLVECLQRTLNTAEAILGAIPILSNFLNSLVVSDIMEAMDFFVVAFELGLRESVHGIKEMMQLIFSRDASVKEAVLAAYKKLYLTVSDEEDSSIVALTIAKNLILFLHGAEENEVVAIEEFVKEFTKNGDISKDVIKVLWDTFQLKLPTMTDEESISSIILISMIASVDSDLVTKNLDLVVDVGLGPRAMDNLQLAKESCNALLRINQLKSGAVRLSSYSLFRLSPSHKLFDRLTHLLVNASTATDDKRWMPFCEKAVAVIFQLGDKPQNIIKSIIQEIAQELFKYSIEANATIYQNASLGFCRLLFLCGHAVYCYVVYLEMNVFNEMKRRIGLRTQKSNKKKLHVRRMSWRHEKKIDNDNVENECEDFISEFIYKICEQEILLENAFFGTVYKMVLQCCQWSLENDHGLLSIVSSLSLAKFMAVNEAICEDNLQLIISLMEKSPDPLVRSNLIIAIADLLIRFPNVVQPWTPHLCIMLKDTCLSVRQTAAIIFSHLILHDMIRVKGQIGEIAICIVDEENVARVSKHLFYELSKKQNVLYNVLPDLISTLSDSSSKLNESDYHTIVSHVFQYIDKDRQIENLVEKLCHRIKDTDTKDQLHKIALTMSLLNFNEKSLRKLFENKVCFKNKLNDEVLVKHLKDVLASGRKNNEKMECEIDAFIAELKI